MPDVGIVGSRNFSDDQLMSHAFRRLISEKGWAIKDCRIVSGGARGADTLAERLATSLHIPAIVFKADWDRYGMAAGFLRNKQIVLASDYILAFFGPPVEAADKWPSKGTLNTIETASKEGVSHEIHFQPWYYTGANDVQYDSSRRPIDLD